MAYVISICGAGGKTTKCFELAYKYLKLNKTVAITTTTHMFIEDSSVDFYSLNKNEIKNDKIYFVCKIENNNALPLNNIEYNKLCEMFDIIIIEADGSRRYPMKIPKIVREPVIPLNTNEIVVLMGGQAIGRKIGIVCHRYNELKNELEQIEKYLNIKIDDESIVDEKILNAFIDIFYIKNLKNKYQNAIFKKQIVNMQSNKYYNNYNQICFSICASGLSSRFGSNKLLYKHHNKFLICYILDTVIKSKKYLIDKFNELNHNLNININVILNDKQLKKIIKELYNDIIIIENINNKNGISESIKSTIRFNDSYDAICFLNADIPYLTSYSFSNMIFNFLCSNKQIGCMCVNNEFRNPAIVSNKYFSEILKIDGDNGLKQIIDMNVKNVYSYHIDKKEIVDIDTINDFID